MATKVAFIEGSVSNAKNWYKLIALFDFSLNGIQTGWRATNWDWNVGWVANALNPIEIFLIYVFQMKDLN